MNASKSLLHYREEDHRIRDIDDLGIYARVSRAFLRLCIENGCPTENGQLSQAMLLEWLFWNHEAIRAAAGLPPMVPVEGVGAATRARLQMGNAVLTLLEFCETRSSRPDEKRHLRHVQRGIQQVLDRRAA
jgi:hypothetical protein